ncbi:hypothetical protein ADEAN_000150500 [Angomonas deanei]|uniref:Uncharacterized protein n=1 Tax=Angomonas deanei TaxID=59799 RepID=A0A7G2C4D6_9TRYP|nr:hypothetical protein ADEAN_000150500 [Angomonas deanei]
MSKQTDSTWMKNHPLEGDDVITGFYNFLSKKNPKTMKPCIDIFVPDTVVFEHNFPRGWYTTDTKAKEVMRKQGKDLDSSTIEEGFTHGISNACPIVATYICTSEDGEKALVEVFNKDTIGEFLSRKTKREGILQKFIPPKGYNNSVIKAVWSPRICIVQRRTNKYAVDDRKRTESDPFSVAVTYEGPSHLSSECSVSGNVAMEVKRLCGVIVQHFYYTEHKFITRMVLYFKADKNNKLWLLWCGSLRVADRDTSSEMPVNLVTNFSEPNASNKFDEDKILWDADQAFLRVTKDEMFFETYMKNVQLQFDEEDSDGDAGVAKNENRDLNTEEENALDGELDNIDDFDWSVYPPLVQETYERLQLEAESVMMTFEDLFYKARSHFVTSKDQPFNLDIPKRTVDTLTQNSVVDIMRAISLQSKGPSPDRGMRYVIEPGCKTPITKMLDDCKEWLEAYFARRLKRLREAALKFGDDTTRLEEAIEKI